MRLGQLLCTSLVVSIFHISASAQTTIDWAAKLGGTNTDISHAITVDASGNVYVAGEFYGTSDFDPGSGTYNLTSGGLSDAFVCKLDVNGNLLWARQFSGASHSRAQGVAVDASGNVYTIGTFNNSCDFNPGAGNFTLTAVGGYDSWVTKLNSSGNFVWARQYGGSGAEIGYSVDIDPSGNVLTCGYFWGTSDFDPNGGTYNMTSNGTADGYIVKLTSGGALTWAKQIGGTGYDVAYSIESDAAGNPHVAGGFWNTVDFDPNGGTYNLTSAGQGDVWVLKLTSAGVFDWAGQLGGTSDELASALAVDGSGNVLTTGRFEGTADFDPGAGTVNRTSAGGRDIFVSKLDASGGFLRAMAMGGTGDDHGQGIDVDAAGDIYTTGSFEGTADFDPSAGTQNLTAVGQLDFFISKLNGNGSYNWALRFGNTGNDIARDIWVDPSCNIHTTGEFRGTVNFGPGFTLYILTSSGGSDAFAQKLSDASCVLPVELTFFDACLEEDVVRCDWTTESEIDNERFTLLRSKDGLSFEQIGTVPGAGTSFSTRKYVFYDEHPYSGLSYYQLMQTDFSGQSTYSQIESVYLAPLDILKVYPNPNDGIVQVLVGSPKEIDVTIDVFDLQGRKLMETEDYLNTGLTTIILDVTQFPTADYIFRITTPNGDHVEKEFIKN